MNYINNCPHDLQRIADAFCQVIVPLLKSAGFTPPQTNIPELEFSSEIKLYIDESGDAYNFDPKKDFGYLEALGTYETGINNEPNTARFKLYNTPIRAVAAELNSSVSSSLRFEVHWEADYKVCLRKILALVLCHELAHWFIHQSVNEAGLTLGDIQYQKKDAVYFHEGLAQYLLSIATDKMDLASPGEWMNVPGFRPIMIWMESGQPAQYLAYKKLGSHSGHVLKALHHLHVANLQSFELLEQSIHQLIKKNEIAWNELIDAYMLSPLTPAFHRESMPEVAAFLSKRHPELMQKYRGAIAASKFEA